MYNPLFQQYVHANSRRPTYNTYAFARYPVQQQPINQGYPYYQPVYYQNYYRDYPPVDPSTFIQSANEMKSLMDDLTKIINKISQSPKFAEKLIDEAQKSNSAEVKKMLSSLGLKNMEDFSYTPDGLVVSLDKKLQNIDCCNLTLKLRWRR